MSSLSTTPSKRTGMERVLVSCAGAFSPLASSSVEMISSGLSESHSIPRQERTSAGNLYGLAVDARMILRLSPLSSIYFLAQPRPTAVCGSVRYPVSSKVDLITSAVSVSEQKYPGRLRVSAQARRREPCICPFRRAHSCRRTQETDRRLHREAVRDCLKRECPSKGTWSCGIRVCGRMSPLSMKSVSTQFEFEAQTSRRSGSPIRLARYAAKMLPKFPVGTQTSICSPLRMTPLFSRSQ